MTILCFIFLLVLCFVFVVDELEAKLPKGGVQNDGNCPVLMLLDFSIEKKKKLDDIYTDLTNEQTSLFAYTQLAAARLAIEHFNNRDSFVVPELANIDVNCTVQMNDIQVYDVQEDEYIAYEMVLEASNFGKDPPCIIVGPVQSKSFIKLQTLANVLSIPQFAFGMFDDGAFRDKSSTSVGMLLSPDGQAQRLLEYLQSINRYHLGIIYSDKSEFKDLEESIKRAAKIYNIHTMSFEVDEKDGFDSTFNIQSFEQASKSGYKTFFIIDGNTNNVYLWSRLLDRYGLLDNDEYLYILHQKAVYADIVQEIFNNPETQVVDSPLDRLLRGAMIIDRLVEPSNENFRVAWQNQNHTAVLTELNTLVPSPEFEQVDNDGSFFKSNWPFYYGSYVYDSVIAAGIGACQQQQDTNNAFGKNDDDPPKDNDQKDDSGSKNDQQPPKDGNGQNSGDDQPAQQVDDTKDSELIPPVENNGQEVSQDSPSSSTPSTNDGFQRNLRESRRVDISRRDQEKDDGKKGDNGNDKKDDKGIDDKGEDKKDDTEEFVDYVLNTKFTGATGFVKFDDKLRDASTLPVGVFNIRPAETTADGTRIYKAVLTSKTNEQGLWEEVEAFLYSDGTSTAPLIDREILEPNYLSKWVYTVGISFFVVAWLLAIGCMIGVYYYRKDQAVRSAQPFFLQLLNIGSFILTTSILTLSFDEESGASDKMLDGFCTATPWFFFIGHVLTFSALFTKLFRLHKVLQFRRGQNIQVHHVIAPLVVLVSVTLVILIVWTVVDPWVWNRTVYEDSIPSESLGHCENNNFWAFFAPLCGILTACEVLAFLYAIRTNNVPEDFRETKAVLVAMLMQIQAWFIGIPILAVLGEDNVDATYFGRVGLIFIFSVSSLAVMVAPKIVQARDIRKHPEKGKKDRVKVSGLHAPSTSPVQSQTSKMPSMVHSSGNRSSEGTMQTYALSSSLSPGFVRNSNGNPSCHVTNNTSTKDSTGLYSNRGAVNLNIESLENSMTETLTEVFRVEDHSKGSLVQEVILEESNGDLFSADCSHNNVEGECIPQDVSARTNQSESTKSESPMNINATHGDGEESKGKIEQVKTKRESLRFEL